MLDKKWKYFVICGITALSISIAAGCSKKQDISNKTVNEVSEDEIVFSVGDYHEKISDEILPISVYANNYKKEIYKVQNTEYHNLNFTNCQFEDFSKIN